MNKIIQKKIMPILILLVLFLPAGHLFAQLAPPLPTSIEVKECSGIKIGDTCGIDYDGDGLDDIEFTNKPAGTGTVLESRSLKAKQTGGSQFIESPGIANYIAAAYKNAVILISVLTTIMIIFAGVIWATSAGNPEKINSAKTMIARSVTGLVIALGSYTLLYTINPDLVNFNSLQILKVERGALEIPDDYSMAETGTAEELTGLVTLDGIPDVTFNPKTKNHSAVPEVREKLILAVDQFQKYNSGNVQINYATRTPAEQYGVLTRSCGCQPIDLLLKTLAEKKITKVEGKEWPNYCPGIKANTCPASYKTLTLEITDNKGTFKAPLASHIGGIALDMSAAKTGSYKPCGGLLSGVREQDSQGVPNAGKAKGDVCIPKEQQKLIRAMLDNGFCVGLKGSGMREPWHFELTTRATSPFCANDYKNDANLLKLHYLQNPTDDQ